MTRAAVAATMTAMTVVLAISGCHGSSPGHGSASSTPPVTTSPPTTPSTPVTSSPTTQPTVPTTSAGPSTPATSSAPAPSTPVVPPGPPTCSVAALTVRVLHGGAVPGAEIALITLTNMGAATCTLDGFPTVTLYKGGQPLGSSASPSTATPSVVTLAPGGAAQARITDHSTCQAATSDTVRVQPPGTTGFVDRPLTLRGCPLVVDPLSPAQ